MHIDKAKALKIGATVACPADRGDAAFTGKVEIIGTSEGRSMFGVPFVWISVRHPSGRSAVWPSNRIN